MLHYFDLFLAFYNLGTKTFSVFGIRGKGPPCFYVTKIALNQFNSILFLSPPGSRVLHQTPLNAAITPDIQANENTAAKNFQIRKL